MTRPRRLVVPRSKWLRTTVAALLLFAVPGLAMAPRQVLHPEYQAFIDEMVQRHGFDYFHLWRVFKQIQPNQSVVRAISAPVTSRPWSEFRPLFVDQSRIATGVKFWNDNAEVLARARSVYGVPEAVTVALIGIETRYGRQMGSHRVVEAVATLAFDVPERAKFFRGELEQFLLLCRDQGWQPLDIKGSYAGAMGMPQFIPSSMRRFAVDFDGDGKTDVWGNPADAVGSVANYLRYYGWEAEGTVAVPARLDGVDAQEIVDLGMKPILSVADLRARGVELLAEAPDPALAALIPLVTADGPEYWLGFNNFHALLQYNRSRNYAMAVYQLSLEIAREREGAMAVGADSASAATR